MENNWNDSSFSSETTQAEGSGACSRAGGGKVTGPELYTQQKCPLGKKRGASKHFQITEN